MKYLRGYGEKTLYFSACYTGGMFDDLNGVAKRVGDELINISASLDRKMDKWGAVPQRPQDLSSTECVGFINKETSSSGLNMVIDIQAPEGEDRAVLRTWGIASETGDGQVERFNNIQLDFAMDYSRAREITTKGNAVTRENIRAALHDQDTKLTHVLISNQSGFDNNSQQPLGERYDLTVSEIVDDKDTTDKVSTALTIVLDNLKKQLPRRGKA